MNQTLLKWALTDQQGMHLQETGNNYTVTTASEVKFLCLTMPQRNTINSKLKQYCVVGQGLGRSSFSNIASARNLLDSSTSSIVIAMKI